MHAINQKLADSSGTSTGAGSQLQDDDLYDLDAVCRYFGGTRPLHPATIYRGIVDGRYPRPVRVSTNANRWLGRELKEARQALIERPREPLPSPRHYSKR
jgi:predicted DNA-binding transcriptional regulator AlpA